MQVASSDVGDFDGKSSIPLLCNQSPTEDLSDLKVDSEVVTFSEAEKLYLITGVPDPSSLLSQNETDPKGWQYIYSYYAQQYEKLLTNMEKPRTLFHALSSKGGNYSEIASQLVFNDDDCSVFKAVCEALKTSDWANVTTTAVRDFASFINGHDQAEKSLLFQLGDSTIELEAAHLEICATIMAKLGALDATRKEINPILSSCITAYEHDKQNVFGRTPGGRAAYVDPSSFEGCRTLYLDDLVQSAGDSQIIAKEDLIERAAEIFKFLKEEAVKHNSAFSMNSEQEEVILSQITRALQEGKGLRFSLYISLEKFPNPHDTLGEQADLAEVQFVLQLKKFIETIDQLSGQSTKLTILNESPANKQFSVTSSDDYLESVYTLLNDQDLSRMVEIVAFDRNFFVRKIISTYSHFDEQAVIFYVNTAHDVMKGIMSELNKGVQYDKIDPTCFVGDSERGGELALKIHNYFQNCSDKLAGEIKQGINSERQHSIDSQLLFPYNLPDSLYRGAVGSLKIKRVEFTDDKKGEDSHKAMVLLRKFATEQALKQAIEFKALMRLRSFFEETFAIELLPDHLKLSITGQQGKFSVNFGRTPEGTQAYLEEPVSVLNAPHATGIIVPGGRLIIGTVEDIIHTKSCLDMQDSTVAVSVRIGGKDYLGFQILAKAVFTDIDGTILKKDDKKLSDEACQLVFDCINRDKIYGFITARAVISVQKIVINALKEYAEKNHLPFGEEEKSRLWFSGNNGAWCCRGDKWDTRNFDYELLLVSDINPREDLYAIAERLQGDPTKVFGKLFNSYIDIDTHSDFQSLARLDEENPDNAVLDRFALYFLNSKYLGQRTFDTRPFDECLGKCGLEKYIGDYITLAAIINEELKDTEFQAFSDGNSIDIVRGDFSKGTIVEGILQSTNIDPRLVLTTGDSPRGNDEQLVERLGGVAVTTNQISKTLALQRLSLGL
jgi:hydroxymethylpyrimidine pyrophosphatase-like HAD family hydrolase